MQAQIQVKIETESDAYAEAVIRRDPFIQNVFTTVLPSLAKEKARLFQITPHETRIPFINSAVTDINNAITEARANYRVKYLEYARKVENKVPNVEENTIKNNCEQRIKEIITSHFVEDTKLNEHRIWGTVFARCLLNTLMAVTIVPAYMKYRYTGNAFFHLNTTCAETVSAVCEPILRYNRN